MFVGGDELILADDHGGLVLMWLVVERPRGVRSPVTIHLPGRPLRATALVARIDVKRILIPRAHADRRLRTQRSGCRAAFFYAKGATIGWNPTYDFGPVLSLELAKP